MEQRTVIITNIVFLPHFVYLNINPVCLFFSHVRKEKLPRNIVVDNSYMFLNLNYNIFINSNHRVYRVPEYPGQSSELAPPTPSTASECVPPGSKWGGGHTLACGKGAGELILVWYGMVFCINPFSLTQTVPAHLSLTEK
jgi:hypothetical protein